MWVRGLRSALFSHSKSKYKYNNELKVKLVSSFADVEEGREFVSCSSTKLGTEAYIFVGLKFL